MEVRSTPGVPAIALSQRALCGPRSPTKAVKAWRDIVEGLGKSWLWTAMAMQDMRLRYRGSLLGPFWITMSTAIMIGAMGIIYPRLFHVEAKTYLPFLTTGLIVWQFVSNLISDGCTTFTSAQNIILQAPMPFTVHVYRLVYRNFLIFLHNSAIVPIVLILFPAPIGPGTLVIIPALLLLAINGIWISTLLGMLSARFRDVPPIIANIIQVLFFVTPIFWPVAALGPYKLLATFNPMFAAVDVVRAPLLGVSPEQYSWGVLIVVTISGSALTFALFARFRSRIAYWV